MTGLPNFRHLLGAHDLGAALFTKFGKRLLENGPKLSGDVIVDDTTIALRPA